MRALAEKKPEYVILAENASAAAHERVKAFAADLNSSHTPSPLTPLPSTRERGTIARYSAAAGAAKTHGMQGWNPPKEEQIFEAFQSDLIELQSRGFDLHVNVGDIRGHNHGRSARCVGKGAAFKCVPLAVKLGLDAEKASEIARQIDELGDLHSDAGGFDAAGRGRSEGILQYVAFLTHFVFGSCLIHRVWNTFRDRLLPFSVELIPGSRISTPYTKMGDPLVHHGIVYADDYRSKVTGWYVRRVPKTIGNSSVALPEWDFISVDDGSMLELVEPAGVDRSFPNAVAAMRLVFNRHEMVELNVEAARKHSTVHAVTKVKSGHNPQQRAEDLYPEGWSERDGVKERFAYDGDETTLQTSFLPGPDFPGFHNTTDGKLSRALNTRLSELTRTNQGSYSGGMQENQIDKPNVDVMRENFVDAWRSVQGWKLDACYLSGAVEIPNYTAATKVFWLNTRVRFPGEVPLNPVDHENAKNMRIANGTSSEITECEAEGRDYYEIQREKARAWKIRRQAEKDESTNEFKIPIGTLDPKNDLPDVKESTTIDGDHDGKIDEKNRKREHMPGYSGRVRVARYKSDASVARYFAGSVGDSPVDIVARTIKGVAIATLGKALGHGGVEVDVETLNQIKALCAVMPVRSRMNHPESKELKLPGVDSKVEVSGDLENMVGTFDAFRIEGDKVLADFYAVPEGAPAGKLATGLLNLANDKRAARTFGVSILCKQGIKENKIRVADMYAIDWVDVPALNPTGVFSGDTNMDPKKMPFEYVKGEDGKYTIKMNADCKAGESYGFEPPVAEESDEDKKKKEADAKMAADAEEAKKKDDEAKAAANRASATGAKAFSAADIEAAKIEARKEAANEVKEFNAVLDAAKIFGKERDEFTAAFSGCDIKAVKFHANKIVELRAHAVGSEHTGSGKDEAKVAEFVTRFSAKESVRSMYGCHTEDKNSKEWKDALAEYLEASIPKA